MFETIVLLSAVLVLIGVVGFGIVRHAIDSYNDPYGDGGAR